MFGMSAVSSGVLPSSCASVRVLDRDIPWLVVYADATFLGFVPGEPAFLLGLLCDKYEFGQAKLVGVVLVLALGLRLRRLGGIPDFHPKHLLQILARSGQRGHHFDRVPHNHRVVGL